MPPPRMDSPIAHIEFVYDSDGRCRGYYVVSETGEIHNWGEPEYVPFHGRSDGPSPG